MSINVYKKINELKSFENFLKHNKDNVVFVCVGNFEVWYDSYGPIVGELLINKYNIPTFVYGNIKSNIKLSNLSSFVNWVKLVHFDKKIIVIDAALSNKGNKEVVFKSGPIKCAYYSDKGETFGDYAILCPVNQVETNGNITYKSIIDNALLVSAIINNYIV